MLVSRRDLLKRSGMGFAALGLTQLLAEQKLLVAAPVNNSPLAPHAPHFAAKAKRVIHLFMNGGPSHIDTFDPKPALARYAGQALPRENLRPSAARRRLPLPVSLPAPWPERHRGQRIVSACRLLYRRHRRGPLHACRRSQSRTLADADELRRCPADSAQLRLVGHLWTGQREPKPPRLHRDVSGRLSDPGNAKLAIGLFAGCLSGNLHRHPAHRAGTADRKYPQPRRYSPAAAPAA